MITMSLSFGCRTVYVFLDLNVTYASLSTVFFFFLEFCELTSLYLLLYAVHCIDVNTIDLGLSTLAIIIVPPHLISPTNRLVSNQSPCLQPTTTTSKLLVLLAIASPSLFE